MEVGIGVIHGLAGMEATRLWSWSDELNYCSSVGCRFIWKEMNFAEGRVLRQCRKVPSSGGKEMMYKLMYRKNRSAIHMRCTNQCYDQQMQSALCKS